MVINPTSTSPKAMAHSIPESSGNQPTGCNELPSA
jgi:hypothetical protein